MNKPKKLTEEDMIELVRNASEEDKERCGRLLGAFIGGGHSLYERAYSSKEDDNEHMDAVFTLFTANMLYWEKHLLKELGSPEAFYSVLCVLDDLVQILTDFDESVVVSEQGEFFLYSPEVKDENK